MDAWDCSLSPTARRFQSGTPPIPAIYAGITSIEDIDLVVEALARHKHVLA